MLGFLVVLVCVLVGVSSLVFKQATMWTVKSDRCDFKKRDLESISWSNLPFDILIVIIGRLYFVDQIRFRATCKSWRQAHHVQPTDKLPWLMTHDWNWDGYGNVVSICEFHYPSLDQIVTSKHKMKAEEWQDVFGASICASKYGWLFLQRSEKPFLYNPFTKEIFKLPDMKITFNRSTFSTVPTSPECVFFSVQSSKNSKKINISICRRGDLEWTTYTFDGFRRVVEDVVYIGRAFFCVFSGGVLGAFSVELQAWKQLTNMEPIAGVSFHKRFHMVESDGQLCLVCRSEFLHIFQFDFSQLAWVKINGLENRALFLGCTSFLISTTEDTSDLAERIYFQRDGISFYYYRTNEYQKCSQYYPWISQRGLEGIWIEPPRI